MRKQPRVVRTHAAPQRSPPARKAPRGQAPSTPLSHARFRRRERPARNTPTPAHAQAARAHGESTTAAPQTSAALANSPSPPRESRNQQDGACACTSRESKREREEPRRLNTHARAQLASPAPPRVRVDAASRPLDTGCKNAVAPQRSAALVNSRPGSPRERGAHGNGDRWNRNGQNGACARTPHEQAEGQARGKTPVSEQSTSTQTRKQRREQTLTDSEAEQQNTRQSAKRHAQPRGRA
jgi:hypothetical protein